MGTFIAYPFEDVKNVIDAFKRAFAEDESAVEQYITEMATISMAYARGGTSRLSAMAEEYTENHFIKDGLKMVEDRYTETDIRSIMTAQIRNEQQRLLGQVKIIQNMSSNAPAFGVLGTLIGLVVMMSGLDPSDQVSQLEQEIERLSRDLDSASQQSEGGGANWQGSFSDMVSLLLCFFIVMTAIMAIKQGDPFAVSAVIAAMQEQGAVPQDILARQEFIKKLEQLGEKDPNVAVQRQANRVRIII